MSSEIGEIKAGIAAVSDKITKRIGKLENDAIVDSIIMLRQDPTICKAIKELHDLQCRGREICITHNFLKDMYREFTDEPKIIRKLELSEACAKVRVHLHHNCTCVITSRE